MRSAHRDSHPLHWTVVGFAHGTLPEHAEGGWERFVVGRHPDGSVFYDLYAFFRPNHLLSGSGYPFARVIPREAGKIILSVGAGPTFG